MSRTTRIAGGAAAAVFALLTPLLLATSASAASSTTIQFVGESSATAAFGADWSFAVEVSGIAPAGWEGETTRPIVLGPTDGTVSVTVSGVGGTFASGIPLQEDGRAYISQPLNSPLLPAGEYQVTAIFVPAGGTDYVTSQTASLATLTVTPLALSASAEIISDTAVSDTPFIEATLSGDYLEALGGTPPGTWTFSVSDGSTEVFSVTAPQAQGSSNPIRVGITEELRPGRTFTLTSTFTPVDEVAGGIELAAAPDAKYSTPGTGLIDAITTQVPFPIWLMFTVGGIVLALVVVVTVLGVKLSRRNGPENAETDESLRFAKNKAPAGIPGDPANVELADLAEFGITDMESASFAEKTTWALSDNEPAPDAVDDVMETVPERPDDDAVDGSADAVAIDTAATKKTAAKFPARKPRAAPKA